MTLLFSKYNTKFRRYIWFFQSTGSYQPCNADFHYS